MISSFTNVWTALYGRGFADRMVEIERHIPAATITTRPGSGRWR